MATPKPSSNLISHSKGFDGFGPSILVRQTRGQLRGIDLPNDRIEARGALHDCCPIVPGVYGWLNSDRQLVYVGKSKSLRKRLLTYFAKNPSDNKMLRIRQHSRFLVWEPISDELLALIREQELIFRWQPEFNSQGQPTRMQPAFLCVSKSPAPNVYLARHMSKRKGTAYGPISGTNRLRGAIETLNYEFHLRDCPDKTKFEFNNQRQLFEDSSTAGCIRHELGTCPAPCASKCSTQDYQRNIDRAIAFLDGRDASILEHLKKQMIQAAVDQSFERAATIRDNLNYLNWLDDRLSGLRLAEKTLDGVLPVSARKNRTAWLVLRNGRFVESLPGPDHRQDRTQRVLDSITKIAKRNADVPNDLLEISLQLIVISWFRKHPDLKRTILTFAEAQQQCRECLAIDRKMPA